MRRFNYEVEAEKLLTPEVVKLLTELHAYRGKQTFLLNLYGDALIAYRDAAREKSMRAADLEKPLDEAAKENYQRCLDYIREHFDTLSLTPVQIMALHKKLLAGSGEGGGHFKREDRAIEEQDADGKKRARFIPTPASEVSAALDALCEAFGEAWDYHRHDRFLLIAMFVLDFLCIHPFADGNERLVQLLVQLLLYRAGFYMGAYASREALIAKQKEAYFETLQYSSIFWQDGTNNYEPFVRFYLGILVDLCKEFEEQTWHLGGARKSKPERIRHLFADSEAPLAKRDILARCPDIAKVTVERALTALQREGYIKKIGAGPGTAYVRKS